MPARSQSSNSAVSTLEETAPARSILLNPTSRSPGWREPTASRATWTSTPLREQVVHGLRDADVRLDAADDRLVAAAEIEPVGAHGGEDRLLDGLLLLQADLGRDRPEALRVLGRRDHRHAEDPGALDEPATGGRHGAEGLVGPEALLDVDHQDGGPLALEQAHAAPTTEKVRCR